MLKLLRSDYFRDIKNCQIPAAFLALSFVGPSLILFFKENKMI